MEKRSRCLRSTFLLCCTVMGKSAFDEQAYCTSLWGQHYDLRLLQLVRSSFSNVNCPKKFEFSWLPEYADKIFPSEDFFLANSRRTMAGFIRLKLWKNGSGSARHGLATTELCSPTLPSSVQDLWKKWTQLQMKINIQTDFIKTMPLWMYALNQSYRWSNTILSSGTVFKHKQH